MADNPPSSVGDMESRWGQLNDQIVEMRSYTTELISRNAERERKLAEAEAELLDKKDVIRCLRLDLEKNRHGKPDMIQLIPANDKAGDASNIVLVLVDANYLRFNHGLVSQGHKAGRNAATLLRDAVLEEVKDLRSPSTEPVSVIVRIFGTNTRFMAMSYSDSGDYHTSMLHQFLRGFNSTLQECYYIDVGSAVAEKLEVTLRSCLASNRCIKILFGGASNAAYIPLLKEVAQHQDSKVTLIAGPPLPDELDEVMEKLGSVAFKALFDTPSFQQPRKRKASCDLPKPIGPPQPAGTAQPAGPPQLVGARQPTGPLQPADMSQSTGPIQFSKLVRPSPSPGVTTPNPTFGSSTVFGGPAMLTGSGTFGSFLPARLPTPSLSQIDQSKPTPRTYAELVKGGHCVHYHILGKCGPLFLNAKCPYTHGARLDDAGVKDLAAAARKILCGKGQWCLRMNCIYGHKQLQNGDSKAGIKSAGA